jgi:hypothetical protein
MGNCRVLGKVGKATAVLFLLVAAVVGNWLLLAPEPARAATPIYVDAVSGNDDWDGESPVWDGVHGPKQTIEAGISAVDVGGTVQVAAGNYTPAGGRLVINKTCTIQAEPGLAARPKINTSHSGWTNCAIQIAADGVVLEGLEVDNSAAGLLVGYIVGDYDNARNGWTVRDCDIHNGRNAIRVVGNNVTIEGNNLHQTRSDLINCEYGDCFGLKVRHNWLHSHHSDLGGKPAGLTYRCSSEPGADVEITYNYVWACRTFIDFESSGGLAPANHILVAHNTVDWWIGDLPDPIQGGENAQQMSIAWWTDSGNWNGPNFEIRDNLFTRQKWYAVVDTDSRLSGQIVLQNNQFWQTYLVDAWYPTHAYPNEWPGPRGAVGWGNMGSGNEFVMQGSIVADPLYAATGTAPDLYYGLRSGSPARKAATDGTNIGAWQGNPTAVELASFTAVAEGNIIRLEWETATEINNLGFHLYRSETPDDHHTRLNNSLIPSLAAGSPTGAAYHWPDWEVQPGVPYFFWLELVDTYGGATLHGPVSATARHVVYLPVVEKRQERR